MRHANPFCTDLAFQALILFIFALFSESCSGRHLVPQGSDPSENCFTLTRRGID